MCMVSWCNGVYSVSKKKRNRDSILNLSKSKGHIKLLSVDDSIFIFLSYMVHIGSGMAAQQSFL